MYIQIRWKTKPTDRFSITGMQKNQTLLYIYMLYVIIEKQEDKFLLLGILYYYIRIV